MASWDTMMVLRLGRPDFQRHPRPSDLPGLSRWPGAATHGHPDGSGEAGIGATRDGRNLLNLMEIKI